MQQAPKLDIGAAFSFGFRAFGHAVGSRIGMILLVNITLGVISGMVFLGGSFIVEPRVVGAPLITAAIVVTLFSSPLLRPMLSVIQVLHWRGAPERQTAAACPSAASSAFRSRGTSSWVCSSPT